MKGHHFSSDMEVIAAAETWLDGQPYEVCFHLSGLQMLDFGHCSSFPSWSCQGHMSIPVHLSSWAAEL
jgi:hypothetical protein